MSSGRRFALLTLVLALAAPALAPVMAQDDYERWGGWRDRINVRAGAFFLTHDTFALLRPEDIPEIPGVDLEVIPSCGHVCNLEQPESFNRLCAAWLERTFPRGGRGAGTTGEASRG